MSSLNVSVSRDLLNDYINEILSRIDVFTPNTEDLREARRILVEMSNYIIQSPVKDANQMTRPRISRA